MNGNLLKPFLFLLFGIAGFVGLFRIRFLEGKRRNLEAFSRKLLEAQEMQGKRIARELHDSVGQNLLIIKNRAQLGMAAGGDAAAMTAQLEEISEVCSVTIEETRRTAHNLGARHLEQLGLTEALDAMIDRVEASTGIQVERRLEAVDDLFDMEAATNVYRIAQEALNNVMKHAHASSARVQLLRDLHHVQLMVQDNGCGLECDRLNNDRREGGLGLTAIGERVRILNGSLEVESEQGKGTTVNVLIPYAN